IAELVRHFETALVAATHPGARWRVIIRRAFGGELLCEGANELWAEHRPGSGQAHAVEKIAASDGRAHPKFAVVALHVSSSCAHELVCSAPSTHQASFSPTRATRGAVMAAGNSHALPDVVVSVCGSFALNRL